jgi:hypothetical protein
MRGLSSFFAKISPRRKLKRPTTGEFDDNSFNDQVRTLFQVYEQEGTWMAIRASSWKAELTRVGKPIQSAIRGRETAGKSWILRHVSGNPPSKNYQIASGFSDSQSFISSLLSHILS